MQRAKILLVLILLFSSVSFAADECYICDLMAGKPQAQILLSGDMTEKEITAHLFYENFSAEPSRTPIDDSLLFVYVVSADGETEVLKMFTGEEGSATFDFSDYALIAQENQIAYEFRIIYCPFCHPEDEGYPCGFDECIAFSGMEIPSTVSDAENPVEEVPLAEGAELLPEDEWKRQYYLPASASFTYMPPPPVVPEVPSFCFPILLIFALLAGAMYFSGKNPFAGFNLGTPRMGRHIRYTPGGRGMSMSGRYIAQTVQSVAGEVKGMAKAGKEAKDKAINEGKTKKQARKAARKAAWKHGMPSGKEVGMNMVTLGVYGALAGTTVKTSSGAKGGIESESTRGGVIKAIKEAPKTIGKAKAAYKAGAIAMKPETIEGKAVKGKGYGAQVFEGLVRAGGGMLSANMFGSALAQRMMSFVVNKDLTALSQQKAEQEIAEAKVQKYANKLDKLVQDDKIGEVTIQGKTYYEIDKTTETKDGKVIVTTTRIDKQALLDGKVDATVAIGHENHVEVRHFTGEYVLIDAVEGKDAFNASCTAITFTKGSGRDGVSGTYVIADNGEMVLQTLEFDSRNVDSTAVKENIAFVKNFSGKQAPADLTSQFAETKLGAGETIGSMGYDFGKSNFKISEAVQRQDQAIRNIAIHSYYKTDEELKEYSRKTAENIESKMKKTEISDSGIALLTHETPEAGEKPKEHYATMADAAVVQEGGQNVAKKFGATPTEAEIAGAEAVYSMGIDLAVKSDKAVKAEIKKDIMAMEDLGSEQKNEAIKAANELYPDARKTAEKWDNAANEASNAYDTVYKIVEKNTAPAYKKEKEAKDAIVYGATNAGITGYFETQGLTKKEKHNYMQDEIAKATLSGSGGGLAETPEQKFLAELAIKGTYQKPEEPKLPEQPRIPELPEPVRGKMSGEEQIEYVRKMSDYQTKLDYYKAKMQQYNEQKELQDRAWEAKQKDLIYGEGSNAALGGALVLTSAIQKGYKLPDNVYEDAVKGINSADPGKWKNAAVGGMKEVEEKKKEKGEESKKKMAKDLSEFEM